MVKMYSIFFSVSLLIVTSVIQSISFDPVSESQLFDYSHVIIGISDEIALTQVQLDLVNSQLALLQSADGYNEVVAPAVNSLIFQQAQLVATITDMQAVLNEITDIMNLDADTRALLYYFYTVLGCSYIDFMVRMPFNYQSALVDPVITALLTDVTNTAETKKAVAELVYQNYSIDLDHICVLTKLYQYLL